MTTFSPTQKEDLAEILGCDWHCADCGTTGPRKKVGRFDDYHNPNCVSANLSPVLTLEAMFAYCREQKWDVSFEQWTDAADATFYAVSIGLPFHVKTLAQETVNPDPIVAFGLALLAAHKEAGQ